MLNTINLGKIFKFFFFYDNKSQLYFKTFARVQNVGKTLNISQIYEGFNIILT